MQEQYDKFQKILLTSLKSGSTNTLDMSMPRLNEFDGKPQGTETQLSSQIMAAQNQSQSGAAALLQGNSDAIHNLLSLQNGGINLNPAQANGNKNDVLELIKVAL